MIISNLTKDDIRIIEIDGDTISNTKYHLFNHNISPMTKINILVQMTQLTLICLALHSIHVKFHHTYFFKVRSQIQKNIFCKIESLYFTN